MKISYIITPFDRAEYLIRCVNSLYRQWGSDYEVILGENFFWSSAEEKSEEAIAEGLGELRKFLKSKKELIQISTHPESREEKLREAFSLVSEDCDYVMFIDVNTVVSPVAAMSILGGGGGELIIPAAAIREDDEFVIDAPGKKDLLKNLNEITPLRLCYGRDVFERFEVGFFEAQDQFQTFIISLFIEEAIITEVDEICIYSPPFPVPKQKEQKFEAAKENSFAIFSRLFNVKDVEVQILIFERLILQFTVFLGSEEYEIRAAALSALKVMGAAVQDKLLFRKFFEVKTELDIQDFLSLDYSEYEVYKVRIAGKRAEAEMAAAGISGQEEMIENLGSSVEALRKELDAVRKEIAGYVRSQNQAVAAVVGVRKDYSNPVLDIPQMYCEGRLGLKTIIRSFGGWLKYKVSRKKGITA